MAGDHVREALFRRIAELDPWERNFNLGDVAAIARSIQMFGFNGRLATHGATVMAGNHALAALRRLREAGAPPPAPASSTPACASHRCRRGVRPGPTWVDVTGSVGEVRSMVYLGGGGISIY